MCNNKEQLKEEIIAERSSISQSGQPVIASTPLNNRTQEPLSQQDLISNPDAHVIVLDKNKAKTETQNNAAALPATNGVLEEQEQSVSEQDQNERNKNVL